MVEPRSVTSADRSRIPRFIHPGLPDIVRLEQLTCTLHVDRPDDVDHYTRLLEALCIEALPANKTRDILNDLASHLKQN